MLDLSHLGRRAGVSELWWQAPDRVNFKDYYHLLTLVANELVPNIVLRLARTIQVREFGALGYAVWSGARLGQSLEMLMHVVEWQHPYVRLQIQVRGEHALINCHIQPAGVPFYRVLVEDCLFTLWLLIQSRLPAGLAACASFASFTFDEPEYHGQYQQLLGCKVRFAADQSVLAIPAQWLSVATTSGIQSRAAPARVRRSLALASEELIKEVKTLLLEHSVECGFDMVKTARLMAVSDRSLRRHLADAGTSFRDLCSEVRMELAKDYLQKTGLTVQEIAFQLGYAQANNFYRAFRSSVGMTPLAYRLEFNNTGV